MSEIESEPGSISEAKESSILDLVFVVDCTSSMGSYIQSCKDNIHKIVEGLMAMEKVELRFGLVEYRDHPPQDATFVSRVTDFTSSVSMMKVNVDKMAARGGGDGPESVCCGFKAAFDMPYHPRATKVVIFIADAPPHGLGEGGDGFPDGCPHKMDPLELSMKMAEAGIVIYSVGCEPSVDNYENCKDFMLAVSSMTGGQYVGLSNAELLTNVIIGSASEQMSLEKIMEQATREAQRIAAASETPLSDDEIAVMVASKLDEQKVKTTHLILDHQSVMTEKAVIFSQCCSLATALSAISHLPKKLGTSFSYSSIGDKSEDSDGEKKYKKKCKLASKCEKTGASSSIASSVGSFFSSLGGYSSPSKPSAPPPSLPSAPCMSAPSSSSETAAVKMTSYAQLGVNSSQISRVLKQAKSRGLYEKSS